MNTWTHPYKLSYCAWATCGYIELEISYLSRTRDLSHKPEKVSKVNSQDAVSLGQVNSPENIEHNSRWTYLSEILIFGLDSRSVSFLADSLFQAQRTTNIHFRPGENQGENCLRSDKFGRWSHTAPTRLGPTETWLASNKTSAILDSQSAGMRRSFAQIYYFVLVFLNVFSKRCCEGLYHWWRHELC